MPDDRTRLIALLQLAYSGEKAAAYAYRGHWKSISEPGIRARIQQIEEEEWHHRRLVGEILQTLGAGPNPYREIKAAIIGRTLGLMCHLSGWLLPMYGAGKLESRNIREYEVAARYSRDGGHADFVDCLLRMAEVEWEHEHFFRLQVQRHRFAKLIPLWPEPAPKISIRESFDQEHDGITSKAPPAAVSETVAGK